VTITGGRAAVFRVSLVTSSGLARLHHRQSIGVGRHQ
jgi:predicted NUDIX family phosphoesterase